MNNKDQHWVPQSYLKAWIDPTTPPKQAGYVWLFSKDGNIQKNKAPKNIFNEPDFYTKTADDGSRDLSLEKKLSQIESVFTSLRRNKLDSMQDLTLEDISKIIVFVSIMLHRTKLRRDNEDRQWKHILKIMDDMAETIKKNPKNAFRPLQPSNPDNSMSHDTVRKIANEPIQSILMTAARVTGEILSRMNMHIICAPENSHFITSDHPCVVFDPVLNGKLTALGSPSIEVTFPISPKQMVIFFWGDRTEPPEYAYTQANENVVDEFNRRTRFFCDEYFIANNKTKKDFWFE
jgi:hypothetical protein